jgi:hypothetical protein
MPRCFPDGEVVVDSRYFENPVIMSSNGIESSMGSRICFSSDKIAMTFGG